MNSIVKQTLIRGGRVLTMEASDPQEMVADVLVTGDTIAAIEPNIAVDASVEIVDASGMIVLPGFVDAHRHTWQTQLRTTATDWSLFDYLARMRLGYSGLYTPEDVFLGNYVGALEAINAGVTTIVDHSHIMNSPDHADAAVSGLDTAGGRAIFCYGIFPNPSNGDLQPLRADPQWMYADAQRVCDSLRARVSGRVLFGMAPSEAESVPFDVMRQEIEMARALGARRISYHVAMGAYDHGRQIVQKLADTGLLGDDMLFVHGAALTETELASLRDSGAALCVTPESELQMGMGFPVGFKATDAGVTCGLGIDIVSNYPGNMFNQMRMLLQTARAQDNQQVEQAGMAPRRIHRKASEALRMATVGGAAAAGLAQEVGSLVVGKQADLLMVRTDRISMAPAIDAVGAVVLNASPDDVDTVWVGGRVLKRHGQLTGVAWDELRQRLVASSARIQREFQQLDVSTREAVCSGFMPKLEPTK